MAGLPSTFTALKHRDFRWLWTGTFFATAGQWVQQATLGWVIYELTGSASLLGAILGVRAIPMLLLAPVTGVLADRLDRRRLLMATQLAQCAVSAALMSLTEVAPVW